LCRIPASLPASLEKPCLGSRINLRTLFSSVFCSFDLLATPSDLIP
jgi:hypothetical protein